ncbi:MAG TPA: glycosyltransferase family A protein [Novosphingobium sp.]|nr:glycosyltransferase family A protein [Novosphingobium sp.]
MDGAAPHDSAEGAPAPAISLVLPVHNGARYLEAALDSILTQTFTDFELIAVDDCSSDSTPAILARYAAADRRVRVLTNAENLRLPASLNRGFAAARGAWYSWTSDDNLLRPAMLQRLWDAAQAQPGCAVIHSDYTVIDADGAPLRQVRVGRADQLLLGNGIGCSFLYRAEVHHALGGFDEHLFGLEDYDFWIRAARQFRFHPLHEDLYLYRRHDGSLTDRRAKQISRMANKVLRPEMDALPRGRARAEAYVSLCCRDFRILRPGLLGRAALDDPAVLWRQRRAIAFWIRHSLRQRLFQLGLAAAAPAAAAVVIAE